MVQGVFIILLILQSAICRSTTFLNFKIQKEDEMKKPYNKDLQLHFEKLPFHLIDPSKLGVGFKSLNARKISLHHIIPTKDLRDLWNFLLQNSGLRLLKPLLTSENFLKPYKTQKKAKHAIKHFIENIKFDTSEDINIAQHFHTIIHSTDKDQLAAKDKNAKPAANDIYSSKQDVVPGRFKEIKQLYGDMKTRHVGRARDTIQLMINLNKKYTAKPMNPKNWHLEHIPKDERLQSSDPQQKQFQQKMLKRGIECLFHVRHEIVKNAVHGYDNKYSGYVDSQMMGVNHIDIVYGVEIVLSVVFCGCILMVLIGGIVCGHLLTKYKPYQRL